MNRLWVILFLLSTSALALEELSPSSIRGLIPSQWLDHTGFSLEGEPEQAFDSPRLNMLPLLPLYQSGGLGKKAMIGGVIESEYLSKLSRSDLREVYRKISESKLADGTGLSPYTYNGKIYAIRNDYNVSFMNSTSIGISLDFTPAKTVVIGKTSTLGFSFDFGSPFRIGKDKGLNAAKGIQETLRSWNIALGPDETQSIVDQAIQITPVLLSYLSEPRTLLNDSARPMELLPARKNELSTPSGQMSLKISNFSGELKSIQKDVKANLAQEIKWKTTIAKDVKRENILQDEEGQALVQSVCDRLATLFETPMEIWPRCKIAATLVPNAWAYPGGDIFISAGLLGIISEIDSLALILGHEIGHVMARHTSKSMPLRKSFNYAATYVSTAVNVGLAGVSLTGGMGFLGNVNLLTWWPQMMASSIGGGYLSGKALEWTFFAPYAGLMLLSRNAESQSDRLGQEVAFAAGADLEKMNKGWSEFISYFDTYVPHKLGLKQKILADHPSGEVRLANFEKRSKGLFNIHQDAHASNAFSSEDRTSYQLLHKFLRPYSQSYGRKMQQKFQANRPKDQAQAMHFTETLAGPQGLCVRHALGVEF